MSTIFVTGATGLTGANVCQQLIERGDEVRALVRNPDDAPALAEIGVELVQGDIADADDVLDAGKAHGMRRVVALSTSTFFDLAHDGHNEHAPVLENPPDDPCTVTKLAAFREVHERAAAGDDVLTCHPGAIYGPSPVPRLVTWLREIGKIPEATA